MRFDAMLDTSSISALSRLDMPHTMSPNAAMMPPIHPTTVLFRRLSFCLMPTKIIAVSVEMAVAMSIGMNTSVGLAACSPIGPVTVALIAKTDTGIMVSPEVFSARNIICASDAVSFFGFRVCSDCMALSPIGVAALSSPSMLAEKFMSSCPCTSWFLGMLGNSLAKNGPTILAMKFIAPAFSPMFIIPSHSVITPAKGRAMSMTAILDISNVLSIMRLNTSVSPMNTACIMATTKATMKNAIQM